MQPVGSGVLSINQDHALEAGGYSWQQLALPRRLRLTAANDPDGAALDLTCQSLTRPLAYFCGVGRGQAAEPGRFENGLGQRVLRVSLQACRQPQHQIVIDAGGSESIREG